jgi:hypothetical protein
VAGYDPDSDRLNPLFNPRTHHWADHFHWLGSYLKGVTAIGRTTVSVLRMNQPERVEFRRLLQAAGVMHPE